MVTNASGIPASRVHPMADGESLPGPRARSAAGKHARDLDAIASDETGLQRCPRQLRKLLPHGRRQVARHATSRKAATAAFNPHSAPPPERRFSATRSFDYRSRRNAIASGSMGAPRPPVKRLSALRRVAANAEFARHVAGSSIRGCRQSSRKARHSSCAYRFFRNAKSASSGL